MKSFSVPFPLEADVYQMGHGGDKDEEQNGGRMIPPGMENFQLSIGTYRHPLHWGDQADNRLISAGQLPFVLLELENRLITNPEIEEADWFLQDFRYDVQAPHFKPYPYPRKMFQRIVSEHGGRIPVCVMAMPDGYAHYVGEPHIMVWTDQPEMGELVGWLESTLMPYGWSSTPVATRGRIRKERLAKEVYKKAYPSMAHRALLDMVSTRFVDFGRRGAPASQITGIAHLLNWLGTDTCDAAYAAAVYLNNRRKFGANSIYAAAHRTVTPWASERMSWDNMLKKFGNTIFSFVADSYEYEKCLRMIGESAKIIKVKGGWVVARPDSGDPVETVLLALQILSQHFDWTTQESGLKVIHNASVIQGDGVSDRLMFEKLFPAVIAAGFCPSNVVIGMGEYNHRAVRSDIEDGFKTAVVGVSEEEDGPLTGYRGVMKGSKTLWKRSFPCPVSLHLDQLERRVRPISIEQLKAGDVGDWRVLYDGRPNPLPLNRYSFDESRDWALNTWEKLPPVFSDTFDPEIRRMQEAYMAEQAKAV